MTDLAGTNEELAARRQIVAGRRPSSGRVIPARFVWVFLSIATLFVVNALIGFQAQLGGADDVRVITAANEDLLRLRRVQLLVRDAETGQRGYILTREETYREPYDGAVEQLDAAMADLERSLALRPEVAEHLAAFVTSITAKRAELAATLAYAEANEFAAAARILSEDQGLRAMEEIRTVGAEIGDSLDRTIGAAQGTYRRNARRARITLLVAATASMLLLGGFVFLLRIELSQKAEYEHLLRDQNRTLERMVAARTAALEDINEQYRRSNRELESFAYVVSHDLQEPLRKIQAFGDRLTTKYSDGLDSTGRDYVERMRLAAGRMSTLLSDLLDFSRVNTRGLKLTDIDLSEKIANVLDDIETAIERTGANISIVEPLPKIRADAIQMRQLFQNLITNAIKFQAPGSTPAVEIRGELVDIDGDKYARLVIADNGIGFEERYLDRIFAPFQRLHDRAEFAGTGIGLAICRRICERHGGSISATSELGRGSEFTVTLAVNPANEVDTDLDTNEAD